MMEKFQAPHEKLTEEEVKSEIDKLLTNNLNFKERCKSSNFNDNECFDFIEKQQSSIFKLRRNFSPELTTIIRVSINEMADMMKRVDDATN